MKKPHHILLLAACVSLAGSLSAAVVVNYNSAAYVTGNTNLNRTTTSNTTTYSGGTGRSEVLAFSESTALSPASGYDGPTFYGGYYRSGTNATSTNGSSLRRIINNASFDYIDSTFGYYTASAATATEGAFTTVFLKQNFSTLSSTPNLTFEASNPLSINIQGIAKAEARWMIKDGGTYYVSNLTYTTTGAKTLASANDTTWAIFDPSASLRFSPSSFSAHAFADIQAVGFYAQSNDPTVEAANPSLFRVNAFSASLVASSIPEPSSFAALAGLATLGLAALRRRPRG